MGSALGFLGPAAAEARALGHNYIGTEHLLLALMEHPAGVACVALRRLGVGPDEIRDRLLGKLAGPSKPRIDPEALATLGESRRPTASRWAPTTCSLGLLSVERSLAASVLAEFGVSFGDVRVALGR